DNLLSTIKPGHAKLGRDMPAGFDLRLDALSRARQQVDGLDLRGAAEEFVATSLLMPMMTQMRDDPFKSELFHGGFGEDAFLQQFDQLIADRMSTRMSMPIVDAIYQQFAKPTDGIRGLPGEGVDVHG